MEPKSFACTNCGAALDYTSGGAPTVRCPYCGTTVIVPPELRDAEHEQTKSTGKPLGIVVLVAALVLVAVAFIWLMLPKSPSTNGSDATRLPAIAAQPTVQRAPTQTPPTVVPTASLANKVLTFGSAGTGPGTFNRATNIAVDGAGNIYVGDRQGGRIQVFDPAGKFVTQWIVGDSKTILYGIAADRKGIVYTARDGSIERHEGASGKLLDTLQYSGGNRFESIALAPDGGLAAMWYQEHPGTLDPREGVQGDLVQFDAQGKVTHVIPSVISAQTDGPEREVRLAVDGTGNLYALSRYSFAVFKFSREGKFISRFGSRGEPPQPDQFSLGIQAIAVDNQGRIFVA
ncbi:MAG TPA: hypothetical protein VF429_03590, partial [Anaerolineae bacterium]